MVVNCERVWQEISNYLDGDVDPVLREAMEVHFKECKHCTAVLDGTRNVIQLYGDGRVFELPSGFSQRLEQRVAHALPSTGFGSRSFWLVAVAAGTLMVGGLTLGNSSVFSAPDLRSQHAQPGREIPPEMMVAVSKEGKTFHVPGCKYLHKHENENVKVMAASEAIRAGYTPCIRCLRQYLSR